MALIYRKFCTISSRIKGDHCYRSDPKINVVCSCSCEPANTYSNHAIVVRTKKGSNTQEEIVGHIHDRLAEVLYQPLLNKNVLVSCRVNGQSRSAPEGVWVQGGGIEIPRCYEVEVRKELKDMRRELKKKLELLTPTADDTI